MKRLAPCLLVAALALGGGCHKGRSSASAESKKNTPAGGLQVEESRAGEGAIAANGKIVSVQYVGKFTDGTKFDSSYDRGQPIDFLLGAGKVIRGMDMGIEGMKVGGKRKLVIPPELAYGTRGTPGGPIPPNATLVFEVELVGVK